MIPTRDFRLVKNHGQPVVTRKGKNWIGIPLVGFCVLSVVYWVVGIGMAG